MSCLLQRENILGGFAADADNFYGYGSYIERLILFGKKGPMLLRALRSSCNGLAQ